MDIIETATRFLRMGISVIPINYKDKRPAFQYLPLDEEGEPTWEPYKTSLPDWLTVSAWFNQRLNYGVVAGWQNLVVLDFDDIQEYNHWMFWAMKTGGSARYVAENAFRVSTSRGAHVYIRLPFREKNRKVGKIDIKANGYVLGPGSVHPSGAIYTPLKQVWAFPLVSALSDVLPADMLVQPTQAAPVWQPAPKPAGQVNSNLVKKIKASFPIENFFPQAKQSGRNWLLILCPLHDDHHPSFWINTEQQICGCFAGCTPKPLDAINLYARIHGISNTDAIRLMGSTL